MRSHVDQSQSQRWTIRGRRERTLLQLESLRRAAKRLVKELARKEEDRNRTPLLLFLDCDAPPLS